MSDKKPFEIAREALKQITARKLLPTPVNYQAVYNEIAGVPNVQPFPEEPLRRIAQALPARNPGQEKQRSLLEYAIGQRNWAGVQNAMVAYAGFVTPGNGDTGPAPLAPATPPAPALTPEFFEQVARLIEYT
ncbi:MAG: GGDEF domain-containing protein, partial [Curvibacter sp.]